LNPFHWGFEFYEVFDLDKPKEERGFDVIIGNPPWIQSKIMDNLEKEIYKTLFKSIGKQFDSFNLFVERSMVVLNCDGQFSYIVPNRFLANPDYSSFRKYLLENNFIRAIVDVGEGVFVGVTMPALLLFSNKKNNQSIQITTAVSSLADIKGKMYVLPAKEFLSEENNIISIYLTPDTIDILRKIDSDAEKFDTFFTNARGVEIGKKSDMVADTKINEEYHPFLVGEDIDRYIIRSQHFIKLGIKGIDYKDESLYRGQKILIRKTGRGINATIDYNNRYVIQVIYIFKLKNKENDIRFFLLLLNSELLGWYYLNKLGEKYKQAFPHLRQQDILALPIKVALMQQPFIRLCDYMLFLNETEERRESEKELIEFIDTQIIDSLVYELYFKEKFEEDGLKTNLLRLIEPYLKDIANLKTDEEKLKVVREVVEEIKRDSRIMKEIGKIKSHEWVKIIEGRLI
jgi:type I restriction-modification system DNA methylase subunit